jgi:DNA polymerase-3 subunit alpha
MVRFGMGAIKGVGAGDSCWKIEKTEQVSFDLTKRIDLRAANKKALKTLIFGGFDSFGNVAVSIFSWWCIRNYLYEKAIKYGAKFQEKRTRLRWLFRGSDVQIEEPVIPPCEDWSTMEKLRERGCRNIYIRTSIRWLQIWDEVFL